MPSSSRSRPASLRIAIFHFGFFYSGGGEKLVLEEIRGLRRMGHEVSCFAPYVDRQRCFPDWPEIQEVITLLPAPPRWLPLSHAIWVIACCVLIPLMAGRFRSFDVLFGANQPAPWLTFVLSRLLKKPNVIYLAQPLRLIHPREIDRKNGLRIRDGDQRLVRLLTKWFGRFIAWADRVSVEAADLVLVNGEHAAKWIETLYQVEPVVCPSGCHPALVDELDYRERLRGQLTVNGFSIRKPFVLLTNRHSPMKRFEYGLWAMKHVLRHFPASMLVITGQQTDYTWQLRSLTETLNIVDSIQFVGLVSEEDLRRLYLEASLYIYTSPEEDFGMGIVEAMASGTPVVAWNRAGPTVTVENEVTGFLAEPDDGEAFAKKMMQIMAAPELAERMGAAGHARARERYSYENHCRILEWAFHAAGLTDNVSYADPSLPAAVRVIRE